MPSDVNRFLRTHLLTVPAEDAPKFVDLEQQGIAIPLLVLARDELDAVRRTDGRAEAAGDALRLAVFRREHPVRAPPTRRERPFLFRILHRHLVREQMLQRQRHATQRRADVARLRDRAVDHLHANSHQSRAPAVVKRVRSSAACRSFSRFRRSSREYAGLTMRPRSMIRNTTSTNTMFSASTAAPNCHEPRT